ncbi:hypothetical protein [Streptomyces sp. NPDC093795]|uniref:hypothetical protein n=1 Tax=Streptomyces sp. NPDC093795 TaxID=3366051 RepID=UPI00382E672F
MPDPAVDPRARRAPKTLAGMAGLACVACCVLPALIAAGVVGTGASAVVGWLPALAVALAVLASVTWWFGQRRRSCSCKGAAVQDGRCGCHAATDPHKVTAPGRQ